MGKYMAFLINKNSSGHLQPMSDINVTPFVDVMLVLLVIFMVTAPMMVTGLDVNLPQASARPIENADNKLVLSIKSDRKIFLGDSEVSLDRLEEALKTNEKLRVDKEILLHADQALPYGFVAKIMSIAKDAGISNVGMVTDSAGDGLE
jgi:biopolymer transport protein TolR